MSYCFGKLSISREVRRVTRQQLEGALKEILNLSERDRSTAVHEARKCIKRVRALIRLVRPAVGNAFYKRENAALREAAHRMAEIRDAHVRAQTIQKVIARSRSRRPAFTRIRKKIFVRLQQVLAESGQNDWCKHVATDIERAICRLPKWPLKKLKPKSLRDGLARACKKARRALAAARRKTSAAKLHELRKRIKDLSYALQLLGGNRPAPIKALDKRMSDLGDKLGSDHDLTVLLAARHDYPLPEQSDWGDLEIALAPSRLRSNRAALRVATKHLKRKPGAFADFVFDRWDKWRSSR
jgi:CHAD domain-containing protein